MVYHFMLGPGWVQGCPSCSFLADHFDGAVIHLAQRDVSLVVVSRAPLAEIEAYKKRMGWKFKWVSSFGNSFNNDQHVLFSKDDVATGRGLYNFREQGFPAEEAPGVSVFYKDTSGQVYHSYSSYARGGEPLIGVYAFLDLVPKGRDEDGLAFSMSWVRHHDRYDDAYRVEATKAYAPPPVKEACCGS